MRKYISLLLFIIIILSFVGCDVFGGGGAPQERTKNYLEIYSDFLRYSLGDYVIIDESTHEHFPAMSSHPIIYTEWTLQYIRYDGNMEYLSFNNRSAHRDNMGEAVMWAASSLWLEQIKSDIISYYFPPETMDPFARFSDDEGWTQDPTIITTLTRLQIFPRFQGDSMSDMLDSTNGLKLQSVTLLELFDYWDIAFEVSLSTLCGENYSDIFDRFSAMVRTLSKYLNYGQIIVDFRAFNEGSAIEGMSFRGYYNKQTDDFYATYR